FHAAPLPRADRGRAVGIARVRNAAAKCKYLLRFLGYQRCVEVLERVTQNEMVILPTWPSDIGDRRHSSNRQKMNMPVLVDVRSASYGRRRLDSARVIESFAETESLIAG